MKKTAENVFSLYKKLNALCPRVNRGIPQKNYEDSKKDLLSGSTDTVIRKLLHSLLEAAKNDDAYGLERILLDIEMEVIKTYSKTGENWSEIKEILDKIRHTNNHYTVTRWRYEKIQELYKDLCIALNKRKQEGTLKKVFENLFYEMLNTYNDALFNADVDALATLKDQARQLDTLDLRVKNERPDLYDEYVMTLKEIARCIPLIIKLQPIEKDGKTKFLKDGIYKISDNFSQFFSTFREFISSFESPNNKQGKNTKLEKNIDKEDMKMLDKKRKVENLLYNENWSISQISQFLCLTKEEIVKIIKSG